ncbi:DUF2226 domain-containing protein [Thermococcus sp.]|uniref:DUF2226 domain-containing protein n=1 Tax=Thermococcus sp. TaxID=35749 RepID=UPI002626D0FC|nr:DUF2226 domain-containing protein [Thermococcus sp.]
MKLPDAEPVKENAVITSPGELLNEIRNVLSGASGLFIKVFGKKGSSRYYITILFDRSKVLAAEGQEVSSGSVVTGSQAIDLFRELLKGPLVVDLYALDEIGVKVSIADNLDAYGQTPKVSIGELLSAPVQKPVEKPVPKPAPKPQEKPAPVRPPVKTVEKKTEKKAPEKAGGEVEVVIEIPGGEVLDGALKEYAKHLVSEAKRIRTLQLSRIAFSGELTEGVVYLNVHIYGHSEGQMRGVAEKRMLHAISKYAPIILREADIKPILRDVKVILNGKEVAPKEIVDREKKKTGKVDREGRITLSVLEDVWPYFSSMVRTAVGEINEAGIKVTGATFDIRGWKEFEVNAKIAVETSIPRENVEKVVRDVITRHAKELGKTIDRYITVHNIEVEVVEAVKPVAPSIATSAKAQQVLAKKKELEKEVEKLLQQAGIEELSFLTEEKKRESEQALLRSRIEPAIELLKSRLHTELKLIPRVAFKWLKLNWEAKGSTVYLDLEASFIKEEVGGLFGSFSGIDEGKLKQDARDTILRVIRDVSKEYGISIKLKKLNVMVR